MTWIIDKTFSFCYGHRVHTQTLNGEYAADLKCACRHLHGHEGKMQVFLTADGLDTTGMVTDFRHLEWLKTWINTNIDHQFIIDRKDPLYKQMIGNRALVPVYVPETEYLAGWKIDLTGIAADIPEYEYLEGFLIVDFVPTSEKLSEWMANVVEVKMSKLGVSVQRIEWWETPKSRSVYYR
ncbi:MAG TPA: 6-carboxytetrahydropterin synthase [Methanosarcina sp.]|nr:6-carboxytetrahydropterin synthase [Methanosarcina sp.]